MAIIEMSWSWLGLTVDILGGVLMRFSLHVRREEECMIGMTTKCNRSRRQWERKV